MRTPLVATLLGLSLAAGCTVGDLGDGGGGGDDQPGGASCGDGNREGSEACDDGNTSSGDGCSASCQEESTPRLDLVVDKAALATELMSNNMVTLTFSSSGGFSGPVSLAANIVDDAGTTITGWNPTIQGTVDVPEGGTATVVASLRIPAETAVLAGKLNITATSSLGQQTITSNVTALKQITIPLSVDGGNCVYPTGLTTTQVKTGTKVRFVNSGTAGNIRVHINDGFGMVHQPNTMGPGGVYEQTVALAPANGGGWYCHTPGNDPGNLRIIAVP